MVKNSHAKRTRPSAFQRPLPLLTPGRRRTTLQRGLLPISVASNLSLLGFFKYGEFLAFNDAALAESIGMSDTGIENVFNVTLPLGILFIKPSGPVCHNILHRHARVVDTVLEYNVLASTRAKN
jgi:hypothetical protein